MERKRDAVAMIESMKPIKINIDLVSCVYLSVFALVLIWVVSMLLGIHERGCS